MAWLKLPSGNVQHVAMWYRLWAHRILTFTNAFCLFFPLVGHFWRRGAGEMTVQDSLFAILTVLVSLTFPCIAFFVFYAAPENWKRLREEKIYAFHGRYLLGAVSLVAVCGIVGSIHTIIFADFERAIPESVDPIRPPHLSMETRYLAWFTGVSLFLTLAFLYHLMPINPYAKPDDGDEGQKSKR